MLRTIRFINFPLVLTVLVTLMAWDAPAQRPTANPTSANLKSDEPADPRTAKLRAAVEAIYGATLDTQDLDKIADATHQKIIESAGGREQYKAAMRKVMDSSRQLFESITWKVEDPVRITEVDGKVFGVVPRTLEGVTKGKDRIVQNGSMVGISLDNGQTWKFLNGTNFDKLFPEYVTAVQIPKQRSYINGVEQ